jgi:glycosyltransferase involved in cell wall biosynthesis
VEKVDGCKPTVAVVIPCYRQAELLPDALASVATQSWPHIQCAIVDDGSPDDTAAVARELIRKYPGRDIRLLRQENRGLAEARNSGIASTTAPLILPLDADDRLVPGAVARMVQEFIGESRVDLVVPWAREFGDREDRVETRFCTLRQLLRRNWLIYSSMYTRKIFDRVGGYNPNMRHGYEDWDFSIGMLKRGAVLVHVADELLLYRKHGRTMLTDANDRSLWLRARMVCNHPDLFRPWRQRLAREVLALDGRDPGLGLSLRILLSCLRDRLRPEALRQLKSLVCPRITASR